MTNRGPDYLNLAHFENLAPDNSTITRLSKKAVEYRNDDEYGVIYTSTIVYRKETGKRPTVNTDGWTTNTSKRRINHGLDKMNAGYYVYQKDYTRYIGNTQLPRDYKQPFKDGMTVGKYPDELKKEFKE